MKDCFPFEPPYTSVASIRFHSMGLHQENAVPATEAGVGPKADAQKSLDHPGVASGLKLIPIVAASGFAGLGSN